MRETGYLEGAYNINYQNQNQKLDMTLGHNSLFVRDGYYIFAGMSTGFKTKYQDSWDNPNYAVGLAATLDTFVFKYKPGTMGDCFYNSYMTADDLKNARSPSTGA